MIKQRFLGMVWILVILLFLPALVIYISFSIHAKRPLSPKELGRFSLTLLTATLLHSNENGGPRAFAIALDSVSDKTAIQTTVELSGKFYRVPLPPYSMLESCERLIAGLPDGLQSHFPNATVPPSCVMGAKFPSESKRFLTLASGEEFDRQYLENDLPKAGWKFQDRLGAAVFFRQGKAQLMINVGSYLTGNISEFSISLNSAPKL
jgi:hypothetical protein